MGRITVADALYFMVMAFLLLQGATLLLNLITFPRLGVRRTHEARPSHVRVSILVPARNEAHTLPRTLPSWLAQGADEVLVLDDHSSDGTRALLDGHQGVRVIGGAPLPAGWGGKNWACHQLAEAAQGDVLIFTDADVQWRPHTLDAIVREVLDTDAGLLSAWPRQHCETWMERLIVPLVDLLLLANLPHPLVRWLPLPALAGANGQLMAWRRDAYVRVGGHAALRSEVLEDVRMAQRAKAFGVKLTLRLGAPYLHTRMYRGAREVINGFGKNILPAVGGSKLALLAVWVLNLAAYSWPWLALWVDARWWWPALLGLTWRALANLKVGRPVVEALLQPLGPLALTWIVARAWRGGVAWKGRVVA